jgi:hypothetical protein
LKSPIYIFIPGGYYYLNACKIHVNKLNKQSVQCRFFNGFKRIEKSNFFSRQLISRSLIENIIPKLHKACYTAIVFKKTCYFLSLKKNGESRQYCPWAGENYHGTCKTHLFFRAFWLTTI